MTFSFLRQVCATNTNLYIMNEGVYQRARIARKQLGVTLIFIDNEKDGTLLLSDCDRNTCELIN